MDNKKDQIATKTLIIKQIQSSGDILSSSSNFALGFTLTLVRCVLLMLDGGQTVDKISCIMMVAKNDTFDITLFTLLIILTLYFGKTDYIPLI